MRWNLGAVDRSYTETCLVSYERFLTQKVLGNGMDIQSSYLFTIEWNDLLSGVSGLLGSQVIPKHDSIILALNLEDYIIFLKSFGKHGDNKHKILLMLK